MDQQGKQLLELRMDKRYHEWLVHRYLQRKKIQILNTIEINLPPMNRRERRKTTFFIVINMMLCFFSCNRVYDNLSNDSVRIYKTKRDSISVQVLYRLNSYLSCLLIVLQLIFRTSTILFCSM